VVSFPLVSRVNCFSLCFLALPTPAFFPAQLVSADCFGLGYVSYSIIGTIVIVFLYLCDALFFFCSQRFPFSVFLLGVGYFCLFRILLPHDFYQLFSYKVFGFFVFGTYLALIRREDYLRCTRNVSPSSVGVLHCSTVEDPLDNHVTHAPPHTPPPS